MNSEEKSSVICYKCHDYDIRTKNKKKNMNQSGASTDIL